MRKLHAGDIVIVAKLDGVGRNAMDVPTLIDVLSKRDIAVRILNTGIDTPGAGGKLFLLLLAGFAEFERALIIVLSQIWQENSHEEWHQNGQETQTQQTSPASYPQVL